MLYISLRQYEYICAIARQGSLSAAAQALNVSQPALSNALTRVESHLGYPLFVRRRGAAMVSTPQGRRFVEQAEGLLSAAAQIENPGSVPQGLDHLSVGCFVDLAPFHLAPALRCLHATLPDVSVSYSVEDFQGLLDSLVDGRIDLAITYDLGMDAGFVRQKLFDSVPQALLSPEHPLAGTRQVTLTELANERLILSTEGLSAQHILGLFRRHGLNPTVRHRAATLEIQRSLAAHGEGVAISYVSPKNELSYDNKSLANLPIADKDTAKAVVLARHGTGPVDATTKAAERALLDQMKDL